MARAKRSLGPTAWACVGSSNAFHRTRSRIRQSLGLVARDTGACQAHATGEGRPRSPRTEASSPHSGRAADSENVFLAPGRGRGARARQEGGGKPRRHQARKQGTEKGDRAEEARGDEPKEGLGMLDEAANSSCRWDQHLAENTALAITAAMWTIATERERATYCATLTAQERYVDDTNGEGGENLPAVTATARQHAARDTNNARRRPAASEDLNPAPATPALELRVSLAAARRFIKSCRLIDGAFVLDADVDLGFKRWEEAGRPTGTGRDQNYHCSLDSSLSPVRRSRKGKGACRGRAEPSVVDTHAAVPPAQGLCEAVGCSDPALYGDVHPLAKARLCRKHRRNGMVDVGSRRYCTRTGGSCSVRDLTMYLCCGLGYAEPRYCVHGGIYLCGGLEITAELWNPCSGHNGVQWDRSTLLYYPNSVHESSAKATPFFLTADMCLQAVLTVVKSDTP